MPLYTLSESKLSALKEKPFKLEKDLQALTESNLDELFGLQFIATEFQLNNLRIDSLAFDPETNSFVIIEYKRGSSFSVVDQGYAYLALLLNNKADFILEYNERMKNNLKREEIDWSQSRVIFVAPSFTTYQRNAINFKDLPIELWEVKRYQNDAILYNQLKPAETRESIKTISKDKTITSVSKEIKTYTVEDHIKKDWNFTRDLYETLRDRLFDIEDRFVEVPNRPYIAFKLDKQNVVTVKPSKKKIRIDLTRSEPKDYRDPEKKLSLYEKSYEQYHQWISYMDIEDKSDIDYALMLVKQALKRYE